MHFPLPISFFLIYTLLTSPTLAHPTTPPLLGSQSAPSTPGYCWLTMYKESNFQGTGLRIAFADHSCYDFGRRWEGLPDDFRIGVKSMDIEEECSCRWVYGALVNSEVVGDGLRRFAGGDCDASGGGRVYWAIGRTEVTGRLEALSCSGAPNHG